MFEAFVLKVLISSPGDTGEEVAAVKESLHGWNGSRAESAQVILLPRHWRSDAVPRLGAGFGGGGGEPVDLFYDGEPFDLLPDSDMRWSIAVFMQSPPQLKLTMRWMEGDEPHEVSQTIAL